jgi:hypothetical protein
MHMRREAAKLSEARGDEYGISQRAKIRSIGMDRQSPCIGEAVRDSGGIEQEMIMNLSLVTDQVQTN